MTAQIPLPSISACDSVVGLKPIIKQANSLYLLLTFLFNKSTPRQQHNEQAKISYLC